jgi:hypothetical protein
MCGEGHKDWVASVDFHPGGTCLASGSGDSTVKIWDFEKQRCVTTFTDHKQVSGTAADVSESAVANAQSLPVPADAALSHADASPFTCCVPCRRPSGPFASTTWERWWRRAAWTTRCAGRMESRGQGRHVAMCSCSRSFTKACACARGPFA